MIISRDLAQTTLLEPLSLDVNELYIVSGYATPNMVSWYFMHASQYLRDMHLERELSVNLIVGMTAQEGVSISDHEGFKELVEETFDEHIVDFTCNYVYQTPSVHSKVYIWAKDGVPVKAFIGSANFSQTAFSNRRREVLSECDATSAMDYYNEIEASSIYCTHGEIEEHIMLRPTHAVLNAENRATQDLRNTGIDHVTLSLLAKTGETGTKSGINWGQRPRRNPNQAYIGLPRHIATSGFFPLEEQHFTVITDDGHQLIMRVEQENDKAITTPLSNALLGEYLRNRLGMANGAYVSKADLERYGRTDIDFYKLDEEQYYLDFSIN